MSIRIFDRWMSCLLGIASRRARLSQVAAIVAVVVPCVDIGMMKRDR